ncbi:MAG: hypothetical protein U9N79_11470 [Actinomycetota bacterium]|nr:hypothetical protein [Actinomycetota bacterium]
MKVKMFAVGIRKKKVKRAVRFEFLEAEINSWLEDNPGIAVDHVHQLSQPNIDWGQLAVAVWYSERTAP